MQKKCNCSCYLKATCERSHLFLLDSLPGAAAGDDTEDASTEFTDSIEEEAAHNSHQQVSPSQVLGSQGGRLIALWGLVVSCSPCEPKVRSYLLLKTSFQTSAPPSFPATLPTPVLTPLFSPIYFYFLFFIFYSFYLLLPLPALSFPPLPPCTIYSFSVRRIFTCNKALNSSPLGFLYLKHHRRQGVIGGLIGEVQA